MRLRGKDLAWGMYFGGNELFDDAFGDITRLQGAPRSHAAARRVNDLVGEKLREAIPDIEVSVRTTPRPIDEDGEVEHFAVGGGGGPVDLIEVLGFGFELLEKAVVLAQAGVYLRQLIRKVGRLAPMLSVDIPSGYAACLAAESLVKAGYDEATYLFVTEIEGDGIFREDGGFLVGYTDGLILRLVAVSRNGRATRLAPVRLPKSVAESWTYETEEPPLELVEATGRDNKERGRRKLKKGKKARK